MFTQALLLACALPLSTAAETILGVYIFHRHGDRTAKSTPPANLTELGFQEVYTAGQYFRDRYVSSSATSRIAGIEPDLVKLSQLSVSAPLDNVLQTSAMGFLSALYPPVGPTLGSSTLRNGTMVQAPLNGFQLIPVESVTAGAGSEDNGWLQGATNCAGATTSSNQYFYTQDYEKLLNSTTDFYKSLTPMINGTFSDSQISFKNAFTIYDLLNVAAVHNTTNFHSSSLLTPEVLFQLRTLADHHELNLAYNASSPIRAIPGSTLAAQVLQSLNATVSQSSPAPKLNIQFGAYASFLSFFGLAQLLETSSIFYGIPDYASSMTFELVTNASAKPFPAASDISVRFLFHNGTATNESEPVPYPLFGQQSTVIPWSDFASSMSKFAIGDQADWCHACGNTTGICAAYSGSGSGSSGSESSESNNGSNGGMSNAVAGVIGAMVTLAVIMVVEGLIILVGGLRLVSKKRMAGSVNGGTHAVKA
ncbi:hypothetical protein MMC30_005810 [Trapelia coarctata]|nr:hypothetical protein [Trapelia coarctata]